MTEQSLTTLVLCIVMGTAIYTDIRERKIYNNLTLPLCVIGLFFGLTWGGFTGFYDHLLGLLIAGGAWFFFWNLGIMGGGDQKLMMAAGAWLGRDHAILLIFLVAFLGGLQSLVWIAAEIINNKNQRSKQEIFKKTKIPYSLAIGAGAVILALANEFEAIPSSIIDILHQFV